MLDKQFLKLKNTIKISKYLIAYLVLTVCTDLS